MSISYNGIGHLTVTFPANDCAEGAVCKLNTSGKACACIAGDNICGVVHTVENGKAAVVLEGFVTVGYAGTAPSCGWTGLSGNGSGGVKVDTNAPARLVVQVDSSNKKVTFKL